ncbi:hypothetical protein KCU96_g58, partial [Aureobasidium melanogenum]
LGFDAFAQSFVEQFLSLIRVACSCGCLGFGRFAASDLRHRSHDKTICEITLRGRDGSSAVDVSLEVCFASCGSTTPHSLADRVTSRSNASPLCFEGGQNNSLLYVLSVSHAGSSRAWRVGAYLTSADEEKVDRMDSRYLGFLSLKYSPASCFKSTCPADQLQLLVQ